MKIENIVYRKTGGIIMRRKCIIIMTCIISGFVVMSGCYKIGNAASKNAIEKMDSKSEEAYYCTLNTSNYLTCDFIFFDYKIYENGYKYARCTSDGNQISIETYYSTGNPEKDYEEALESDDIIDYVKINYPKGESIFSYGKITFLEDFIYITTEPEGGAGRFFYTTYVWSREGEYIGKINTSGPTVAFDNIIAFCGNGVFTGRIGYNTEIECGQFYVDYNTTDGKYVEVDVSEITKALPFDIKKYQGDIAFHIVDTDSSRGITGSIRIKEEEKIIYILTEIKTDGTCRVISVWEEDGSQR